MNRLDNSFATLGQLHLDLSPSEDTAEDVLLLADGAAVLCGSSTYKGYVARITDTGTLDPFFGNGGISTIVLGADSIVPLTGIAVQPDGKYVCSGFLSLAGMGQLAVARFTVEGMLDPSFGSLGIIIADIGTPYGGVAEDIVITAEGSILVCGTAHVGATSNGMFARFISGLETDVNELQPRSMDMRIYPVPSKGQVTVIVDAPLSMRSSLNILDTQGRVIEAPISPSYLVGGRSEHHVDLGFHGSGFYVLRYCTDLGCVSQPVVIDSAY